MESLSISGTVSFRKDYGDSWQTVYTSSLYGTMFSIFGKFDYDAANLTLNSVTLKIINYKGLIDLGIKSVKLQPKRKRVLVEDEEIDHNGDVILVSKKIKVISLKVEVRGLKGKRELKINTNYKLKKDDVKKDIYLEIDRKLLPLKKNSDRAGTVYDIEYYYRDGTRASYEFKGIHKEYRLGSKLNPQVNKEGKLINDKGELVDLLGERVDESGILLNKDGSQVIENGKPKYGEFNQGAKSPGAVCPKGYSKIIF